jgi:hypothetical protein
VRVVRSYLKIVAAACALVFALQCNAETVPEDGIIDAIILGDAASEQSHGFIQTNSDVVSGGLGEPARRLLPLNPVS